MSTLSPEGAPEALPELLPARMLNEFTYCPRLFHLEWVGAEWADNLETLEGRDIHRRVDRPAGDLPPPDRLEEALTEMGVSRSRIRALTLSSASAGLIAKVDALEVDGGEVVPVDTKRGKAPDGPLRVWAPDRIQLGVQALVLLDNGYRCTRAVIYYAASKRRVEIPVDERLLEDTRAATRAARAVASAAEPPPPLVDSPKCPSCSLVSICLPDETRALAEPSAGVEPRRLVTARDPALPVYVQAFGATVGKDGEVFVIRTKDGETTKVRAIDLSQLCILGNATITAPALHALLEAGIPVSHFSYGGWFYGITHGIGPKNAAMRLHQYRVASDPSLALEFAKGFIARKIANQRTMLRRNYQGELPESVLDELQRLSEQALRAPAPEILLGIEGLAARVYFAHFAGMLTSGEDGERRFDFEGRNRRPPRDPVNAVLSLAYSILAKDWTVTLLAVGLDPFLGFFHQGRFGRASMALDLMEEFRPLIADSVVLQLLNNGELRPGHFLSRGGGVALTPDGRKKFFQAYERRMQHLVRHPVLGYRLSYRRLLEVQARLFARALSGEIPDYPGFRTR